MRLSKLFSQTRREAPSEAEVLSHQLLIRAGYIRPLAAGIFSYLPLAQRSLSKIADIMHAEMHAIGGQEISMPVVQPAEIWQETGRWQAIGSEMGRFKDKNAHDMVLAMTHEEVVCSLVRNEIHSYRQMPALIYHIQTKWRDDPRPRAGLIRAREFSMLDSYSLDRDIAAMEQQYQAHYDAYFRIFERCGLPVVAVESDTGMMGGKKAHEFMYLSPIGEDMLLFCDVCGYAANRQIAQFHKEIPPAQKFLPLEKVSTPNTTTIEDVAAFLGVAHADTAKAVFTIASIKDEEEFVFALLRGDMELNEAKLARTLSATALRPASEEEIIAAGTTPGYASPIGFTGGLVVCDDLLTHSANLVGGANEEGYHFKNINYGRDFTAHIVADISSAEAGSPCAICQKPLRSERGVEVGNIFQLGSWYSKKMNCTYLDGDGRQQYVIMGSYGIGLGRLLACIAEEHHDEQGLCLPVSVAPYAIHLIALGKGEERVQHTADALYETLLAENIAVLYDDRQESPGVMFNDADLIGIPVRITISKNSLEKGGVEIKPRTSKEKEILSIPAVLEVLKKPLT